MARKVRLSVVVPFFGGFDPRRLELVTRSIRSQPEKSIEFLVSNGRQVILILDADDHSTDSKEALRQVIKSAPRVADMPRGAIYNLGIRRAQGENIYISDADIMFPERFFVDLLQHAKSISTPLKRPMMRRLLLRDFDQFYDFYNRFGCEESLRMLDFSQEFIVKPDEHPRSIKVTRKLENGRMKTFIATLEDYEKYKSDKKYEGSEPLFFNQERHCGAVFAKKKELENVGGCCERYISWGGWDSDVQRKLEGKYGISYIPGEVIHLDHPKGYFDREKWQRDLAFQEARRKKEVFKCIEEDRRQYESG